MRVVSHHCQHICCGAAREAFMGFLGGSLVCHDGVGSGIAGMDRLENVTKFKDHFYCANALQTSTLSLSTAIRRRVGHGRGLWSEVEQVAT